MTAVIAPPSPSDTRSAIADWLELQVIASTRLRVTSAKLFSVLDITDEVSIEQPLIDEETDEVLDEAILEEQRDALTSSVFEELEYRERVLQTAYPFNVNPRKLVLEDKVGGADQEPGQIVYLFCLLASAIREKKLQPEKSLEAAARQIANSFQICACIAAGGYVNGDVASFGFPRATGLGFLPALKEVYGRFGAGRVRSEVPEGLPEKLKDGGVDVIAWRSHPDGMPSKLYILGQCASGQGWENKSVVEYAPQLHGSWFTEAPASFWQPAMFIPFTFHRDISEARTGTFFEKVRNSYWHYEQRFGIIFDRLRIAHFAQECLTSANEGIATIEGLDHFDEIQAWIDDVLKVSGLRVAT